ncbi:hypothetical protein [Ilyobacter sp.]|uniref:hypothetical protein n=1 Tax=Ilyobacter sp. TaxID=3100343 RepID=UPI003565AFA7
MKKINISGMMLKIKVIGIGKYGIDKINYLVKNKIDFIEHVAISEENQILKDSSADIKIKLEDDSEKNIEEIKKYLKDLDVLFITSEMNDSIEEHLLFKVSEIAKDIGILTIALVSINSINLISKGYSRVEKLKKLVDALIISEDKHLKQPFENSDYFFRIAIKGITDLSTHTGLIGLDYLDIKNALSNSGLVAIGFGEAEGENRALEATQQALNNLSPQKSINDIRDIILNITASKELGVNETFDVANHVRKEINKKNEDDTDILFSTVESNSLGEKLNITIIATYKK